MRRRFALKPFFLLFFIILVTEPRTECKDNLVKWLILAWKLAARKHIYHTYLKIMPRFTHEKIPPPQKKKKTAPDCIKSTLIVILPVLFSDPFSPANTAAPALTPDIALFGVWPGHQCRSSQPVKGTLPIKMLENLNAN